MVTTSPDKLPPGGQKACSWGGTTRRLMESTATEESGGAVTMQREKPNQLSKNWKKDSLSSPQVRQEDKGYCLESMNS